MHSMIFLFIVAYDVVFKVTHLFSAIQGTLGTSVLSERTTKM